LPPSTEPQKPAPPTVDPVQRVRDN